MRNIINISVPADVKKNIERDVREGGFATTSEFFRHLIRLWNTEKLARELKKSEADFKKGKYIVARSLKDLR